MRSDPRRRATPAALVALAALVVGAAPVRPAAAEGQEATVSIDVRATAAAPGSSEGVTKSVTIPAACTYVSHGTTVLDRHPAASSDGRAPNATSFAVELRRDKNGRIGAVALTLNASAPALEPASIGVRLSVVMRCE
jgi:hypothetical protein